MNVDRCWTSTVRHGRSIAPRRTTTATDRALLTTGATTRRSRARPRPSTPLTRTVATWLGTRAATRAGRAGMRAGRPCRVRRAGWAASHAATCAHTHACMDGRRYRFFDGRFSSSEALCRPAAAEYWPEWAPTSDQYRSTSGDAHNVGTADLARALERERERAQYGMARRYKTSSAMALVPL